MGNTCKACRHPKRAEIDRAVIMLVPLRDIATRFDVGIGSIARHSKAHLPTHLAQAMEAEEATGAADLLADLRKYRLVAEELMESHDHHLRLKGATAAGRLTQLMAEIRGAKKVADQVSVTNVQINYLLSSSDNGKRKAKEIDGTVIE